MKGEKTTASDLSAGMSSEQDIAESKRDQKEQVIGLIQPSQKECDELREYEQHRAVVITSASCLRGITISYVVACVSSHGIITAQRESLVRTKQVRSTPRHHSSSSQRTTCTTDEWKNSIRTTNSRKLRQILR